MTKTCPICAVPAYRAELYRCPICGIECDLAELDALAIQWYEEWFDRQEDLRVFGTPLPKQVLQ